ncbi:MAG: dihydropteroate synthase-like protein [Candidatus Helarchaeota archaeon]
MKKILILTGELAFKSVLKFTKDISDNIEVLKLPISVAAFINPDIIIKSLKKIDLSNYDYILCPGLMRGNLENLGKKLGVRIFKGPRYACDIPLAIEHYDELSPNSPADKIFLERELNELEGLAQRKIDDKSFLIGNSSKSVYMGVKSYPIILAEIVNAPKLSIKRIIEKAKYYIFQGANVVDIGAIVGEDNSRTLKKIIQNIKNDTFLKDVPISIDSLNPAEIEIGVEAGADLVLSLDKGNMKEIANLDKKVGVVILPTNVKEGFMPRNIEDRIEQLQKNIENAQKLGFQKIVADPLLEAPINPGLYKSLSGYALFRKINSSIPLIFGIGNVVELIDTDGLGINSIFACLAFELKISAFLTTEYSPKTRGTVKELYQAIKLAYLANKRNMVPKDLPITNFKAKSKKDLFYIPSLEKIKIIEIGKETEEYYPDSKGFFRIWVDHEQGKIFVVHYREVGNIDLAFSGTSAKDLGKKILAFNITSSDTHALYLGRELEKAEICLELGKSYIQDEKFGEN